MSSWMKLAELISKNFKLLLRSKSSSLIIVLGPLLLVFFAGLAFDNSDQYSLKVGAYSPTYTDTVYVVFNALRDNFAFSEFSSAEQCESEILKGRIHACVLFSENFTMGKPGYNNVVFVTDYSQVNLVGTLMTTISEEVSSGISNISFDLTKELVDAVEFTKDRIEKHRDVITRLTTENQIISDSARTLSADLSDIDFSFAPADFANQNLSSSRNKVEHWVSNSFSVAKKSISQAKKYMSNADSAVRSSSADSDTKSAVQQSMENALDKIEALEANLASSEDLASTNFAEFDNLLSSLISDIGSTKKRLDDADASRQLSLRVIDAVLALLDKSLIHLLEGQLLLNEIDNKISAIKITDASSIVQPIVTEVRPVVAQSSYLSYLFPSLIVLVIMFTSVLLGPTLVLLERRSPAFFRSSISPANNLLFYAANFLTCLILILVQVLIMIAIASVFFSTEIVTGLPLILLSLLASSVMFSALGVFLGYMFNSEQTAILGGVSLGAFFIFLSDLIIPLESVPHFVARIANLSPFVLSSDLLQGLIVNSSFLIPQFFFVLLYAAIFIILSLLIIGMFKHRFHLWFSKMSILYHKIKRKGPKII